MSAFTISDWNTIIQAANVKRAEAISAGCLAPSSDLPIVTDPHLWSASDITNLQSFLTTICDDYSFSTLLDTWSSVKVSELVTRINTISPCFCCVEIIEYSPPVSTSNIFGGYISVTVRFTPGGTCASYPSSQRYLKVTVDKSALDGYQLFSSGYNPMNRSWELKMDLPEWTSPYFCYTFSAQEFDLGGYTVNHDGTMVLDYPTITPFVAIAIEDVDGIYRYRPYTITLYGHCYA